MLLPLPCFEAKPQHLYQTLMWTDPGLCFTDCSQVSKQQPRGAFRAHRNLRAILMKPETLFKTFNEMTPASARSHLWTPITLSCCWLRLAFLPVRTAFQNYDAIKKPKTKSQNASHQCSSQKANTGTVTARTDYEILLQEYLSWSCDTCQNLLAASLASPRARLRGPETG